MKPIDLRSDTVTQPDQGMRRAIAEAEVGDDVFSDDPTVIELEEYTAGLFGREASLFVPSGTMGNQVCLKAHSEPGWELLCETECHIVNYEVGGPAIHSNLMLHLLKSERGMLSAEQVRDNIRYVDIHCPLTKMVALENTHNRHGGTVLPQDEVKRLREVCDEHGLILHLDGARIWNAHVASGLSLAEITEPYHSVSVCLSKGLGAPVGSMILGSAEFVEKCRRIRKLFGGAMRQVGIIAAGGLYAIKNNLSRLALDHANVRTLAEKLAEMPAFDIDMSRVETNILVANLAGGIDSEEAYQRLEEVGVRCLPFEKTTLRFVTHLDVSTEDCLEAVERIGKIYG